MILIKENNFKLFSLNFLGLKIGAVMNNNLYWLWLSKININNKIELLEKYKTPENIWKGSKQASNIEYFQKHYEYMQKHNITMITIQDEKYPQKLKNISNPPIVLYIKGNSNILQNKALAMVGCRLCTEYGEIVAKHISYDLAKNNVTVISGLARGIDTYSHMGAIAGNGKTIAVVGNGLDIVYPNENKILAEKIIETGGAIISEYIVGTKPEKKNFPERNRIISGLSEGVIVVEARARSGTFITVDYALEQGREVYAVPGNITNFNSEGTNELLKEGAKLITNVQDILEDNL